MRRLAIAPVAAVAVVLTASAVGAHVTVQPTEAPAGAFFKFAVRVPNERDDASTTKVKLDFPDNLIFVGFQPKDGWKRTVTMKRLDEPIEAFGASIDEVVDTVTWSGGSIRPHEFDEFGFSAKVPDDPGPVEFSAVQFYDSGETVRWEGAPDSEEPAPVVSVVDIGAAEGQSQLGVLAELREEVALSEHGDAEGSDPGALALGGLGTILGSVALVLAVKRRT